MRKSNDTAAKRNLHRYPYLIGLLSLAVLAGIVQVLVILDCFFPLLAYELDAVSSVMSTCSEVLAGFISLLCLVCTVMAEGIVLYGANTLLPAWLHRFWINETLLLSFGTYNMILYFVISVLDPHKVERISNQKKSKISGDTNTGDPEEFMAVWEEIEENLLALREELISKMRFVPGAGKNKPQIVQTLDVLRNYGRINMNLWRKLDKLRQYHNLTLHDLNLSVSQEMCDLAKNTLAELKNKK